MIQEINDLAYVNSLTDYKCSFNEFNKVLGYFIDNKLVGFIDYSKMYERIEINYIFVIKEYRRNRIGYNLLNYVINNNDYENITLEVNVNNINAINLYQKLNFKIINKRLKYYNGIDGYLMERR